MAACGLLTGAKVVICVKFTSKNSDGLHFGLAQTIRHSVTKYSLKVQDPDTAGSRWGVQGGRPQNGIRVPLHVPAAFGLRTGLKK